MPLETTFLTKRRGRSAAAQDAAERLLGKGNTFEWFVDIKLARDSGVTPLPLLEAS